MGHVANTADQWSGESGVWNQMNEKNENKNSLEENRIQAERDVLNSEGDTHSWQREEDDFLNSRPARVLY